MNALKQPSIALTQLAVAAIVLLILTVGTLAVAMASSPGMVGVFAADTGSITGVVMDQDANTVTGADVQLKLGGTTVANATSGSDGRFTLNASAGTYELTISKPGTLAKTVSVTVLAGQTVNLGDLVLQPDNTAIYLIIMLVIVAGAVFLLIWIPRRGK